MVDRGQIADGTTGQLMEDRGQIADGTTGQLMVDKGQTAQRNYLKKQVNE